MADGISVGSLHYDLSIDDKELKAQLGDADNQVKEFGKSVSNSGEKLKEGLSKAAKGFAVVGAGLAVVSKQATDFTADFVKSSKSLGREIGVSTQEASRLTAALKRMGIEGDEASQMFGIFSKNIVASTAALGKNADGFSKLGVSTKDASGKQKDFNTILFEVADRFKKMPDGIDKTAIALELFGRQGKELIKVLNLGGEGIKELEKKADELGLTLNETTINRVAAFIESQKKLKEQTDVLKIAIGTATTPVLTRFNEEINKAVGALIQTDGPVKTVTVSVLAFGGAAFGGAAALLQLTANMVQAWPAISAATTAMGGFGAVALPIVGTLALIVAGLVAVKLALDAVTGAWDAVNNAQQSANNIAPQGQMASLQKQATAARARGDTKEVSRLAGALRALGGNASGTDFWKGGPTWVHEQGPEIIDLPRGSRVIPHELSKEMVKGGNGGNSISVNIGTVNDKSDADYILRRIDRNQQRLSMGVSPA